MGPARKSRRGAASYSKFDMDEDSDDDFEPVKKKAKEKPENKTERVNGPVFTSSPVSTSQKRRSLEDRLFEKELARAIEESVKEEEKLKLSQEQPVVHSTPEQAGGERAQDLFSPGPALLSPGPVLRCLPSPGPIQLSPGCSPALVLTPTSLAVAREDTVELEEEVKPQASPFKPYESEESSEVDSEVYEVDSGASDDSDYESPKARAKVKADEKSPIITEKPRRVTTPRGKDKTPPRIRTPKRVARSPPVAKTHVISENSLQQEKCIPNNGVPVRCDKSELEGIKKLEDSPKKVPAPQSRGLDAGRERHKSVGKIRLGLSRNARVKPLHPSLKPNIC